MVINIVEKYSKSKGIDYITLLGCLAKGSIRVTAENPDLSGLAEQYEQHIKRESECTLHFESRYQEFKDRIRNKVECFRLRKIEEFKKGDITEEELLESLTPNFRHSLYTLKPLEEKILSIIAEQGKPLSSSEIIEIGRPSTRYSLLKNRRQSLSYIKSILRSMVNKTLLDKQPKNSYFFRDEFFYKWLRNQWAS